MPVQSPSTEFAMLWAPRIYYIEVELSQKSVTGRQKLS